MEVQLAASAGTLSFSQTDQWPLPPKQGYPMVKVADPPRQWHVQAKTTTARAAHRLAAVMIVGDQAQMPTYDLSQSNGNLMIRADLEEGRVVANINLQTVRLTSMAACAV